MSGDKTDPAYDHLRHNTGVSQESLDVDLNATFTKPFKPPAKTEDGIYEQLSGLAYKHLRRENVQLGKVLGSG